MKVLLTCLLLSALYFVPASTQNRTECYFCYDPTEVQYCNDVKTCRDGYLYCKTILQSPNTGYPYVSGETLVTRDCAILCQNSDNDELGTEKTTYCCKGSLCNRLYEDVIGISNNTATSPFQAQSAVHSGLVFGFTLFSFVLPSWL